MGRPAKSSPKKSPATKAPKKKGTRAKKDPNAPKRAQSGYMFWLAENRPRLTKPGMGVTDVARKAGEEWRKLTDKSKWEKLAAKDKERYESEMAEFRGE